MKFSKSLLVLSLLLIVAIAGFVVENPYGSKTANSDTHQYQNPVPYVSPFGTPVYTDDFDGANDTAALSARGYKVFNQSVPVGTTWFQGNSTVFSAFNGPTTGYLAANYNATTGAGNIDLWAVLPKVAGGNLAGDSLYFYQRSPDASTYPDSMRIMYSLSDSTPAGTWVELGRFKTSTAGWAMVGFRVPTTSVNGRLAIRYNVVSGGPSGSNSDYIGIDALSIIRSATPPPSYVYPTVGCNYGTMPLYSAGAFGHSSAVLNDTLYITGGSSTGAGATTVQRYNVNSNTYSAGTVLPESKAGHSLVKCGNALYLIGGSSSVTVGGTTNYKYTPAGGWTSIAPLPVALSGHVAVNWGDSVIFVIGGPWAAPATTVYFYRVASNTWGTSTSCLAGRRSAAIGIAGNKIVIACGYNAAFFNNTQIGTIGSDASTISWAAGPVTPLPAGATGSSRPGGTGVGTKFYFVPGELTGSPSNTSDSIRVFDVTAGTWDATMITGRGVSGCASNYWAGVTSYVAGSGKVKILVTGGALGTVFPGLCTAQVDACTVTGVGTIETPVSYKLSQNYPNPFNPVTKINYSLPKQGQVTIKIYDMLGKEVATLVNEVKTAGNYSVEFNASNLASGIYFYKISVNDFSEVKKMTLLK